MKTLDNRELRFIDYSLENYLKIFSGLLNDGKKNFLIRGIDKDASEFAAKVKKLKESRPFNVYECIDESNAPLPQGASSEFKIKDIDAIFVLIKAAPALSSILIKYAKLNCTIIAPITEHYYKNRPALVNSIPKSGVHMLFELMKAFGFSQPKFMELPAYYEDLMPGNFYNLQHMTPDYISLPYSQIKKFILNFSESVVFFMVRDPRDVAISLAHYVASLKDYHILRQYFGKMNTEQQISSIIKGEYPIPIYINRQFSFSGTIRDLMLLYSNWVKYPLSNTIFLRYDDMIGSKGGGSDEKQLNCVWRVQLALHVTGRPLDYAPKVYNKATATFREGKTGGFREAFIKKHHKFFDDLPQDFMELYGYGKGGNKDKLLDLRHFKGCIALDINKEFLQPVLVQEDYKGFNIVLYGGRYYLLHKGIGRIDFIEDNIEKLARMMPGIYVANTMEDARMMIDLREYTDLANRASEVAGLKQDLADKQVRIAALQGDVAARDSDIKGLRKDIEDKQRGMFKLQTEISDRDSMIEGLKGEAAERDSVIERQRKDIEDKEAGIVKLQTELSGRDARIEVLQVETASRDGIIQKQEKELKAKETRIIELQNNISEKDTKVEALQREMEERKVIIESLNKELQEGEVRAEDLNRIISEKLMAVTELKEQINERDENLVKLKRDVSKQEALIKELQNEVTCIKSTTWFKVMNRFLKIKTKKRSWI